MPAILSIMVKVNQLKHQIQDETPHAQILSPYNLATMHFRSTLVSLDQLQCESTESHGNLKDGRGGTNVYYAACFNFRTMCDTLFLICMYLRSLYKLIKPAK